jgi:predicted dehydrogenase
MLSRRTLLRAGAAVAAVQATPLRMLAQASKPRSANDQVQIALIGCGSQGQSDTHFALATPGVKLVGVADCYNGRLQRAKEVWGSEIVTTRDYRELLQRPEVDAVIVATPDHWHRQAACDAMAAGKDVYLEKPMIHVYQDGPQIIEAARKHGRICQVGSQRVSSMVYAKAKELLASGAIGQLNAVQAWWDRNSDIGAWEYTVPPDASTETCDWPRFEGDAPKHAWDAERFFQWRKYRDYGTGVAGDLFVHLFSGTHFITGAHGPTRAMATGGLRFWKDGRDVPDVLLALFDYPQGFNLSLRVNFVNGGAEGEGFIFTGSEGTMEIGGNAVTVSRIPRPNAPGLAIGTFPAEMQKEIEAEHARKYPTPYHSDQPGATERFAAPEHYADSYDHFRNFFASVRTREQPVEDATFGFRAAGAALLANVSYNEGRTVHWNPETMVLEKGA